MNKVKIETYGIGTGHVKGKQTYPSYEDFVSTVTELCRTTGSKAEMDFDGGMGWFYMEDCHGVYIIGIIEVVGNYDRITVDEFLESINC